MPASIAGLHCNARSEDQQLADGQLSPESDASGGSLADRGSAAPIYCRAGTINIMRRSAWFGSIPQNTGRPLAPLCVWKHRA
jgi:hypothetical protein